MDVFPDINKYKDPQEWWRESKELLKTNINRAMENSEEKKTLKDIVELLERVKIRNGK